MIFNPLFIDTEAKQIHHIGFGNSSNSYLFRDIIKVAKNNQLARSFNSNEILDAILKDVETLSKANYSVNTTADQQLYLILSELNVSNTFSQLSGMDLTNNIFDESSFVIATSEEVVEIIGNALNNLLKEFNITIEQPVKDNNEANTIVNSDTTELLSFIKNQLENNQSVTIQIHQDTPGNYYSLTISNMKQEKNEIPISNEDESIYVISLKKTDCDNGSHQPNIISQENENRFNDSSIDSKETTSISYNQKTNSKSAPFNEITKSSKVSPVSQINASLNRDISKADTILNTNNEDSSPTQVNTSNNSVQHESPFRVINFSKHFYERGSIPLEGDNSKQSDLQNPSSLLNKAMHEINNQNVTVDNSVYNKVTPVEKLIQNISQRESIVQNSNKYSIDKSNEISLEMENKTEPINSESDFPLLSIREKTVPKFSLTNSRESETSIDTSEQKENLTNNKEKTESNSTIQTTTGNNAKVEDKNVNETKQVEYHKGVEGKKEVIQNKPVVQNRELNSNGNSPIIIHISQKPGNIINDVSNLQLNDFVNQVQKISSGKTVESSIDVFNNYKMPIRIIDFEQKTKTNLESASPSSDRLTNKLENLNSAVRITYHKLNVSDQFANSGQNSSSDSQTSNENNEQQIVHENGNFEKVNKKITQEVNREIIKSTEEAEKTNKQSNKESDISKSERIEKAGNNASYVLTKDIKIEQPQSLQANQVKVRTKELIQPELNSKIVEEISELVISEKKDKAVIYLEPADMGRVKVALEIIENKLTARLEVDTNSAKEMLHNQVEYLRDSLSNNGIQLSSLSISLYSSEQKNSKSLRDKRKDSSIKDIDTKENIQKEKQAKSLGYNTYEFIA